MAQRYQALGDPSRLRIIEALREAGEPLSVRDLAGRVGLHVNTVRTHLRVLSEAGLVSSAREPAPHQGRPSAVYRLKQDAEQPAIEPAGGGYRLLAEILAGYVGRSEPEPEEALRAAGLAWGRYLVERPAPLRAVTAAEASDELVRLNAQLGFEPQLEKAGADEEDSSQLVLHRCPFLELAQEYPAVTCPVHLGVLEGALAELDAGLEVSELKPLVEPTVCVAELAAAGH